jgi:transcriptional regulator with XRE-family HTH domain
MTELAPTELGRLLEQARQGKGLSLRAAGERAGFSESRWRQLVNVGRGPGKTVVAAALAVDADPAHALALAGIPPEPDVLQALIEEAQRPKKRPESTVSGLAEEIERVRALPLNARERLRVTREIISLYEDLAREQEETAESGS